MKKSLKTRILLVVCLVALLIGALVVPIGAEDVMVYQNSGLAACWFSNRGMDDPSHFQFILPSYDYLVRDSLFSKTSYYFDDDSGFFITDSNGRIPSGFRFLAWSVWWNIEYVEDGDYYVVTDAETGVPFSRVNSNFVVYADTDRNAYYQAGYANGFNKGNSYGYSAGYSAGYDAGVNASYDRGYYQGQEDAYDVLHGGAMSVVTQAYYSATLYRTSPTTGVRYATELGEFVPNFTSNGVYFKSLQAKIDDLVSDSDPDWEYVDSVTIHMIWLPEAAFNYNDSPLYLSGNALVDSGTITTFDGMVYTLSADTSSSNSQWRLSLNSSVTVPVIPEQISIYVGRPYDLLQEVYITSDDGFFYKGFDVGYAEGYNTGVNKNVGELKEEYYNQGYKSGYSTGKYDGIEIAKDGTFTSLMTAVVDAPVKAITGLLDFEILGQNMLSFMGALLSLCLLLIFIKKVVL